MDPKLKLAGSHWGSIRVHYYIAIGAEQFLLKDVSIQKHVDMSLLSILYKREEIRLRPPSI